MNIYDISEKAGVSIATVSRVLNGNSKVSEKTRQKILKVMEENGYQPNVYARGLGLNTMNTVGIVCADCSDEILATVVYRIEQELRKNGYDSLVCGIGYDIEVKQNYMELLLAKKVSAVFLVGSNFVEADPEKNRYIIEVAKKVPVIILNGHLEAPNVYCAYCDDEEAMRRVTMKFLQKTDKILFLNRSLSHSGRRKLEGVKQAFLLSGKEFPKEQHILFDGSIDQTKKLLMEHWEQGERWDVILTSDDDFAVAAYKFSRMAGVKVPKELQIVGYDNSKPGICCEPEITTIDSHIPYLGQSAVSLLMRLFQGDKVPARLVVSGDIIVRGTTTDL